MFFKRCTKKQTKYETKSNAMNWDIGLLVSYTYSSITSMIFLLYVSRAVLQLAADAIIRACK